VIKEKEERFERIRAELQKEGKLYNSDIAALLGVSLPTVRRDLEAMESMGMLQRTHGGATLIRDKNELPFYSKVKSFQEEKLKIGELAASLIPEQAVIGCTGGTTVVSVMKYLNGRNLTVITNAINVAMEIASFNSIEVFVTGGSLRPRSYELIGQVADQTVSKFHFDIALLGVDGISVQQGISTYAIGEANTAALYMRQASEAWVVADHSKIGRIAPAIIAPLAKVKRIITDAGISAEDRERLLAAGIEVLIAS